MRRARYLLAVLAALVLNGLSLTPARAFSQQDVAPTSVGWFTNGCANLSVYANDQSTLPKHVHIKTWNCNTGWGPWTAPIPFPFVPLANLASPDQDTGSIDYPITVQRNIDPLTSQAECWNHVNGPWDQANSWRFFPDMTGPGALSLAVSGEERKATPGIGRTSNGGAMTVAVVEQQSSTDINHDLVYRLQTNQNNTCNEAAFGLHFQSVGVRTAFSASVAYLNDGPHIVTTGGTSGVTDTIVVNQWGPPGQWQYLPVTPNVAWDAPSVVSWDQANRLDVFYRDFYTNHMDHAWWDGTSWGEDDLGGTLHSGPGCSSWGPTRLDCFVVGDDNMSIWHKYWTPTSGWQPSQTLWEFQGHP